jgi:hypothetical protein
MRMGEFPEQARLADTRLPDHRHDLSVPLARSGERTGKGIQFRVTADETSESSSGGGLKP